MADSAQDSAPPQPTPPPPPPSASSDPSNPNVTPNPNVDSSPNATPNPDPNSNPNPNPPEDAQKRIIETTNSFNEQTSSSSASSTNNEHLPKRNPTDDLFSTEKWGVTPIRQDTPWDLPPSPTQSNAPSGAPAGMGVGGQSAPNLPPGISQSGDSFRSGSVANDFQAPSMVANNFGVDSMGANGLANSLGHMNLGGAGAMHSRFDQPWRAPAAKQHQPSMAAASPFANHNLMNPTSSGMQKPMLNSSTGGGGNGNGGASYFGMQQGEFARAPGPTSSILDNSMNPKPFGMANRSSTWSAFGSSSSAAQNEPEPDWPKSTTSGISVGNSTQQSNAFDLVPEFEPGKPWPGSVLMKSVEDDPSMTPGSMARSLAPQRKTIWSD